MASTLICEGDAPCKPCICGAAIVQPPGSGRRRTVCSRSCWQKQKTLDARKSRCCLTCGTSIPITADLRVRFCNQKCQSREAVRAYALSQPLACVGCGENVIRKTGRERYCSPSCARHHEYTRRKLRTETPLVTCDECGVRFTQSMRTALGNNTGRLLCSPKCWLPKHLKPKPHQGPPPKPTGPCRVCGSTFTKHSAASTVCSDECRKTSERVRSRLISEALKTSTCKPRPCRECGKDFLPVYGMKRRLFCSQACLQRLGKRVGKATRRARTRGLIAEVFDPIEIFERDGWRCHLCGTKTKRKDRGTTKPKAPELDHIVSLADGGPHTRANTALACRACNGRKGRESRGQPSLLSWAA